MIYERVKLMISVLSNPREAIELAIIDRPVLSALVVFLLANINIIISEALINNHNPEFVTYQLLLLPSLNLIILAAAVCFFHFIAELFKGDGQVITLFTLLNISFLPALFLVPLTLITRLFPAFPINIPVFMIFIWITYLVGLSIKKLYNISSVKALIVLAAPAVLIPVFFFLSSFLFIASIISFI